MPKNTIDMIVENGQELSNLSSEQIRSLVDDGFIYLCDDCQSYHIDPSYQWIDIELALKGMSNN